MSILGSIVGHIAKEVATNAVANGLNSHLEKTSKVATNKLFKESTSAGFLVVNEHGAKYRDTLDIYDANRNIKYTVKGELISMKRKLHVFDSAGNEIGLVKEKIISIRSPFSMEEKPIDCIIEAYGKVLGKVKSRWSFGKEKFDVDFNSWRIEGNFFGWEYKILDGSAEVASISRKSRRYFEETNYGDTYVIEFHNPNNEFTVLMLVLALYAAKARSKKERYESW